jgi:hypothetical protein
VAGSTIRYRIEPWALAYIRLMVKMGGGDRLTSAISAFVHQRGLTRIS